MDNMIEKMTDEELIKFCQKDMDKFREKCFWKCPECNNEIDYIDSLFLSGKKYIHELRCSSFNNCECNHKMILKRSDEKTFSSIYFDEIFKRYDFKIKKESKSHPNVESYEEIYSVLISTFIKIVAMFNREEMTQTSVKWFNSFFWRSIKNKVVDTRKMNNYCKRSPSVRCCICDKEVGQISPYHLASEGHDVILNKILIELGKQSMLDSGERNYYKDFSDLEKRSLFLGKLIYSTMDSEKRKKVFDTECFKAYYDLFPNSYFRNKLLSTNQTISDSSETEMEEVSQINVFDKEISSSENIIDNINVSDLIDLLINNVFSKKINLKNLDYYFSVPLSDHRKLEIIREILFNKISYIKIKNVDSDNFFEETKSGITSAILKIAQKDKESVDIINKNFLIKS